jgi:hypothetical protein
MDISFRIFPSEIATLSNKDEIGDLIYQRLKKEVYRIYKNVKFITLYHTYKYIMNQKEGIIDISTQIEFPKQFEWDF